jgi:hypothetical protein
MADGHVDGPVAGRPAGDDVDGPDVVGSTGGDDPVGRSRTATAFGDGGGSDPLVVWALAAVHAALLVVVPVAVIVAVDPRALGDLLSGLSTSTGLFVYGALWATTRWTNGRLLDRTPFALGAWRAVVRGAAVWGAVTGVAFLAELLVGGLAVLALRGSITLSVPGPSLLAVLGIAALLAGLVGALVGVALAAVDLAVLRATRVDE